MNIRTKEVLDLINHIETLDLNLNMDKLVMMGHSFGGMTAIEVARLSNKVKCVVPLDPYFHH